MLKEPTSLKPTVYKRASYAQPWEVSWGRVHKEELDNDDRTPFQRDRDRVLFSDAFRRLQYKQQVFVNNEEGDFRTRLTHTLEVAQLTRSVCRRLGVDEALGETCALAHDMGHPPFGHAGEDALNECMKGFGGFNHNVQVMRILQQLESPYVSFNGLNLTWETLESIAKHNGPVKGCLTEDPLFSFLRPKEQCSLEGQIAAECDELAYKHHDLDDGLATGRLHLADVMDVPLVHNAWQETVKKYPHAPVERLIKETIRRMLKHHIQDLLETTAERLQKSGVETVEDVRHHKGMLVAFSDEVYTEGKVFKAFLMENLYRHTKVNRFNFQAHEMIKKLFEAFMDHRKMLPDQWRTRLPENVNDDSAKARVVCDYLASLTDRSALREYQRLFAPMNWG